jgi:hypothetical protein
MLSQRYDWNIQTYPDPDPACMAWHWEVSFGPRNGGFGDWTRVAKGMAKSERDARHRARAIAISLDPAASREE